MLFLQLTDEIVGRFSVNQTMLYEAVIVLCQSLMFHGLSVHIVFVYN